MKLRIPTIARLSFPLASALALMLASTVHAVNYSFGTPSPVPFTITASDQARVIGGNTNFFDGTGSIYWRGTASDTTYMHFDLSSLAGTAINGDVSLNRTVDAAPGESALGAGDGGQITDGQISTADAAWTGVGVAPAFTTIGSSPLVNENFAANAVATWTLTDATFQTFVDGPAPFHGLVLSGGGGSVTEPLGPISRAHFLNQATLTGTADTGQIVVSNATDWSAADYVDPTLIIEGVENVSGGNVMLQSGAILSVLDDATLDSGFFAGSFANDGTLSFGSSVDQTLTGAVFGSGSLVKAGTGTLTLTALSTFTGPIDINGGILDFSANVFNASPFQSSQININNGSTLKISAGNQMPIFDNKDFTFDVNGGGSILLGTGNHYANGAPFSFTTNGGAGNTIGLITTSSPYGMNLGAATATFNVALGTDPSSDLTVTPIIMNGGSIVKTGGGRLTLVGANAYSGLTYLNEGTLSITNSTGLGAGGYNGGTMTYIANNAALELQGDLSITEHFHLQGAGPTGQGVLRSLSGNSSLSTNFALDGDSTIGVDSGNLTISASIYTDITTPDPAPGLTKTGSGTLTLSGSNTYTGPTVVNAGTLKLSAPTLTDNFNATGLNDNLSTRQTGGAATQSWTPTGNVQVGNNTPVQQPPGTDGNYLLLAFGGEAKLAGMPLSNANVPGPLKISFDMFKGNTGNASEWTSFRLSPGGSGFPVAGSGEFGFLYRQSTGMQIFNNNGAIENFGPTAGGDSFSVYLTDSAGTGSPFAGNGTKVTLTQGVGVLGDYTLNTGMGTSLIAFGSAGSMIGGVDNLAVSMLGRNVLNPASPVSLAASGAVLELDNMYQTVASLSGVSGSAVNLGPLSRLTVNGADSTSFHGVIAGPTGSLTKDGPGSLTLTGTNTYTGDTTVNQGTLAVNGSSIADTNKLVIAGGNVDLTGAETVKTLFFGAVQQAPGTYSSNGNQLTGGGTLIVTEGPVSGFTSWVTTPAFGLAPGDQGATADPENDGMKNLLEYALNGDPSVSDPSIQPDLVVTATDFEFTYSRLDLSKADTTQTFEYGSDLSGWTPVLIPAGPGTSTVGAATVTITDTGATDTVQISIPKSLSPGGTLFGRLQVVE